jgi:hypothetical protein
MPWKNSKLWKLYGLSEIAIIVSFDNSIHNFVQWINTQIGRDT